MRRKTLTVLVAILLLGLFLTTIVIASNLPQRLSKSPPSELSKLQVCPDKWYKDEQPCAYRVSPAECKNREYFVVDGERKEQDQMDVAWIKKNCKVKEPEVTY